MDDTGLDDTAAPARATLVHAAVERSESWLQAIITAMAEGLLILDATGRYVFANPSACALLGVPLDHLIGAHYTLPLWQAPRRRSGAAAHPFVQVQTSGRPVLDQEYDVTAPAATARVVALNAVPLLEPDGGLRAVILTLRDTSDRAAREARLRYQALHDPLTGLPNRALFRTRLVQALRRAARHRHQLAVLVLDLDGFKAINDRLGHAAGDHVLVEVGRRLRASVRQGDTVARLGGDEFAVLLPTRVTAAAAGTVAAALRAGLQQPHLLATAPLVVPASVGIALNTAGRDTPEALLHAADTALYQAKQAARFDASDGTLARDLI